MADAPVETPPADARPLTITDLPPDILREVFDDFMDCRLDDPSRIDWVAPSEWVGFYEDWDIEMKRDAIKNARLTCRCLCKAASPYLMPIIEVRLEKRSLYRLDAISRSPLLAHGVHAIEVILCCRPGERAIDRELFLDLWDLHGKTAGELTPALHQRINSHWNPDIDPMMNDWDGDPEVTEQCESIIHRSLPLFHRLYEEQLDLIAKGTVADTIATAVSRMPRFDTLLLRDWNRQEPTVDEIGDAPLFVIRPTFWRAVEDSPVGANLPPVRLLSEIPIAIHNAGMALRAIYVDCFPTRKDIDVFPTTDLRDLTAAFQHLEQVNFLTYCRRGCRRPCHPGDEQPYVVDYIGALLSGPCLKHVDICTQSYSTLNERDSVRCVRPLYPEGLEDRPCRPGPALCRLDTLGLRTLVLTHMNFHQPEWDAFCAGLGNCLEKLTLRNVELLDGSWEPSLDILRRKTESRCRQGKCEVKLIRVDGGEFTCKNKRFRQPRYINNWWDRVGEKPAPSGAGALMRWLLR